MERITLVCRPQSEYELLDSGEEEKLERYGSVILSRPDPQALWPKNSPDSVWAQADGRFERTGRGGEWLTKPDFPDAWTVSFGGLTLVTRATSFKHTGLFPEQISNWDWVRSFLVSHKTPSQPTILNLFAYTGGATLVAAEEGAQVTHVDASKTAVTWARENAALSGLADKPIRWIVEDVLAFVRREIKRGNTYDAIIMDPPAFGHGPKDELWKIEEHLLELISLCKELLSDTPLFVLISGYAAGYAPQALAYNLLQFEETFGGDIQYGDLGIEEKGSGRVLPCGIYGRWSVT